MTINKHQAAPSASFRRFERVEQQPADSSSSFQQPSQEDYIYEDEYYDEEKEDQLVREIFGDGSNDIVLPLDDGDQLNNSDS